MSARLKALDTSFARAALQPAPGGEILEPEAFRKSAVELAIIERAQQNGFTGQQREQFIAQSLLHEAALRLQAAASRPTVMPAPQGWQLMTQQQQQGGLLFAPRPR